MRFKCVCKYWYNMIASPDFVSHHLNNYCNNNNNGCLLVSSYESFDFGLLLYLRFLPIVTEEMRLSLPNQPFDVSGIQFLRILGPCNGIFCAMFTSVSENVTLYGIQQSKNSDLCHSLALVRAKSDLPPTVESWGKYSHGFGLDTITNDYNLVLIRALSEFDEAYEYDLSQAFVYSFAADTWKWKDLEDLEMESDFYFGDEIHRYEPRDVMVSFDMAKEVFQKIKLSKYYEEGWRFDDYDECLALYKDSIALYVYKNVDECLDIWVMDGAYWIKKIVVGPIPGVRCAIGYWKDDQVIVESPCRTLLLCDSSTGEIIRDLEFKADWHSYWLDFLIYKDSLVSITNGNHHMRYLEY